jgi:hypothetical protein
MKKLLSVFMVLIITLSAVTFAAADNGQVIVKLDGQEIFFPDAKPFIDKRDRTLVPIRFVSEAMDAEVSWDNDTQTVTIVKGRNTITYTIGSIKAFLNGEIQVFDTVGILLEDRTFVPLRFISEMLNCEVEWIAETSTVEITSSPAPVAFPEPEITVHFQEGDYDARLLWITLDNLKDYSDCDNYQFKIDFINPSEFNITEQNEGAINGWQTLSLNQWRKLTINFTSIITIIRDNYTTRANKEKLKLYDGMPLEFVLSVKRMCSGEVREYTYSETLQYIE